MSLDKTEVSIDSVVPSHRCFICGSLWRFYRDEELSKSTVDVWDLRVGTLSTCCAEETNLKPLTFKALLDTI